jgi:hypothetical protein
MVSGSNHFLPAPVVLLGQNLQPSRFLSNDGEAATQGIDPTRALKGVPPHLKVAKKAGLGVGQGFLTLSFRTKYLLHLSAEAACFVGGKRVGTADRQMEVHGSKLRKAGLMVETPVSVRNPQSWNSAASFDWSNADVVPCHPQFSPS